jgi:hypothetical protein
VAWGVLEPSVGPPVVLESRGWNPLILEGSEEFQGPQGALEEGCSPLEASGALCGSRRFGPTGPELQGTQRSAAGYAASGCRVRCQWLQGTLPCTQGLEINKRIHY